MMSFQYYNIFDYITIPVRNKRPFIKNWSKLTKTVEPTYCNDDIALHTGKINKIIILDIDVANNGLQMLKKYKKDILNIITPTYKTISGGIHMIFKYDKDIKTKIKIKIDGERIGWDILSDGHIAVCPPSIGYKWIINLEDAKLKKIPIWLKNIIINQ